MYAAPPPVPSTPDSPDSPDRIRQPYLHDKVVALRAPAVVISGTDGQLCSGADGWYRDDVRLLSRLWASVGGRRPVPIGAHLLGADGASFRGILRELGDPGADPTVVLERERRVSATSLQERIGLRSAAREPVRTTLDIEVAADLAPMTEVKSGRDAAPLTITATADGLTWSGAAAGVRLRADPPPSRIDAATGRLSWDLALDRRGHQTVTLHLIAELAVPPVVLPGSGVLREQVTVASADRRLDRLVEQSLADLDALTLADPLAPSDQFLAAGAPWFLTLFGRDAIWAARMLLPLGTDLAAGTLRALARRQGTVDDPASAQQPGKIMHEIRGSATSHDDAAGPLRLPPLYYGTVDATPLWISLLHDAWRWGLAEAEVAALLPAAERAMGWLLAQAGDTGFVAYRDVTGQGLANQGWKDSGDSVQFRDGSLARPPIALCEVQGYAVAAARQAADLFDAFGRGGTDRWRTWADGLAARFRSAFWVEDADGPYPAIALDAENRPVDSVTSNLGHLLGTGLLDAAEERTVATRLAADELSGGYGLRTMSARSAGFNPLAYHGGSIWSHDTAIAITGLAGTTDPAAAAARDLLVDGLLDASEAFDARLPELYAGHERAETPRPLPYPAACRPQAWAAAAAVAVLSARLGLEADAPHGVLRVRPVAGDLTVRGLAVAGERVDLATTSDGGMRILRAPSSVRVEAAQ